MLVLRQQYSHNMAITYPSFSSYSTASVKSGTATSANRNNTDVTYQNFKLYIEGVQVPFESINVSSSYGQLPTANIQIPPSSGLLDIIRGYAPKVHIFYEDQNFGGDRLLFWGHIKSSSYNLDRGSGSSYINFSCEHKNAVMREVAMNFIGWGNPNQESAVDGNPQASSARMNDYNSASMFVKALEGINGVASESEIIKYGNLTDSTPLDKISPDLAKHEQRLSGMPGVMVNLWNQVKINSYASTTRNLAMATMYIPLIEEGIGFFKRTTGHSLLEQQLQNAKKPWCHTGTGEETSILVPPIWQSSLTSAVSREMGIVSLTNTGQYSGEVLTFPELIGGIYSNTEYETITLTSPAEVEIDVEARGTDFSTDDGDKMAVETIIKPRLPFYFSPVCNVLLPRMYSAITLSQDEGSTPTRVTAIYDASALAGNTRMGLSIKSPASIREGAAYNALIEGNANTELSLIDTFKETFPLPGKYEQGSGIRPNRIILPNWLAMLVGEKAKEGGQGNQEELPAKGTADYSTMLTMKADWNARYSFDLVQQDDVINKIPNPSKENLNPFDPNVKIRPWERLLLSTLDNKFAIDSAGSRNASIFCLFNPYIIAGYPMDVIADSPNHPSFHGLCVSVTHSISSRSCSTSVSMAAASSYAELSNYYLPPVPPFLNVALKVANVTRNAGPEDNDYANDSGLEIASSTLIQNPIAKAEADVFYRQVLGVGAVAPDDLVDLATNRAKPLQRAGGDLAAKITVEPEGAHSSKNSSGRQLDDYYSSVGNLRLVSRPIESQKSLAYKFNYSFVDLDPVLYNEQFMNYLNPILAKNLYLEPGASLFLDYMEVKDFVTDGMTRVGPVL